MARNVITRERYERTMPLALPVVPDVYEMAKASRSSGPVFSASGLARAS